jgi:2-oxoglutarate ferredoxin oxidoreductase subunit beta
MSVTSLDSIREKRGEIPEYKRTDFATDQDVRWCPGCGDYAILSSVQKLLAKLPVHREDHVFISGIGCSSRFPYYMNTYGFHTIHGRAPAFASGLKATNPNLTVWVITGDGDSLSIGGNHLIHALRRNFNVNILLFNNRIYGLTKGQYSPTSEIGKKTKSTPMGSIDHPFNPLALVMGTGATFVARTFDVNASHLIETLHAAWQHKGTSFVEIYQNCNIFNDKAFDNIVNKKVRAEQLVMLEHGKPMRFGQDDEKGLVMRDGGLQVATIGQDGVTEDDLVVHDAHVENPSLAFMLSQLRHPEYPEPFGILRQVERPCYEDMLIAQIDEAKEQKKADLKELLHSGYTWTVDP